MKNKSIRGTHDLYGANIDKFNKIKKEINLVAKIFNFKEIQTPIFESSDLFLKPLGEHTDVVLKEMYTFEDRNKDSITLRPEYTTPMIRAAISNQLLNELPVKLYGVGPMFRRERPQKGRYRQFNQINFEIFGTNDSFSDVELIYLANKFLKSLLPNLNIKLYINTLGDRDSLINYKKIISNYFNDNKDNLSEESKKKILLNPIRILDSKNNDDKDLIKNAPSILDYLTENDLNYYLNVKKSLTDLKVDFIEDKSLVRGLDYYCHTVFEFKTDTLGSQDTIIGGGRYDGLIEVLGGKNIPGTGWAGGVERLMLLMENVETKLNTVHFAILDEKFKNHAFKSFKILTDNNFSVLWNYKYNLKKSLSKASDSKAKYIVIVGEDEYKENIYTIKNLKEGKQYKIKLDNLVDQIKYD